MKIIVTILMLIGVQTAFTVQKKEWIDYRLVPGETFLPQRSLEVRANNTIVCTTIGKVCDEDCKRVWVCSNNGGEIRPGLLETCTGDKTCNAGVCSLTPTPECSPAAKKTFACLSEGVFPDPTTCKKYHYCIGSGGKFTDYPRSCPMHYGYNAGTTYCSKNLTNNHCGSDYPVPICTVPSQNAALKDNKSMYYVCSLYENTGNVLYPYLHVCPNGKKYNGNFDCE